MNDCAALSWGSKCTLAVLMSIGYWFSPVSTETDVFDSRTRATNMSSHKDPRDQNGVEVHKVQVRTNMQ